MKDLLYTKHKGCGGLITEENIFGDTRCEKCDERVERYKYTKDERIAMLEATIRDMKRDKAEFLSGLRTMMLQFGD